MITQRRFRGNTGENIACTFLRKEGFKILDRNFLKKWGELDIIAEKDKIIHFFEVKSVLETFEEATLNGHRPEDNVHGLKIKRLRRMIETYLDEQGRGLDAEFQFHVLCVYIDMEKRTGKVRWLKNIIL